MARTDIQKHQMREAILEHVERPTDDVTGIVKAIIELCYTVEEAADDISKWLEVIHRDMPS